MIYSYFTNDAGIRVKGKTFESMADFYNYAAKNPKLQLSASTTEIDLLGRAYSGNPDFSR